MSIRLQSYDPQWPSQFAVLHARLWPAVAHIATAIEHVGSTSVPGLAAKPVLDIDIIIPNAEALPATIDALATLGYQHRGDLGITGRAAFRLPEPTRTHHLYVCPTDSIALRNHLALRDHLRRDPNARDAYSQLKLNLATRYPNDMDAYIAGKTDFILNILAQNGIAADSLDAIRRENTAEAKS